MEHSLNGVEEYHVSVQYLDRWDPWIKTLQFLGMRHIVWQYFRANDFKKMRIDAIIQTVNLSDVHRTLREQLRLYTSQYSFHRTRASDLIEELFMVYRQPEPKCKISILGRITQMRTWVKMVSFKLCENVGCGVL